MVAVEHSLISGKSAVAFDPAFNRLGQFAAAHVNDAVFISSDWGSATQLYCNLNGADNTVFETFWGANAEQGVLNIASATSKKTMYIVTTGLAPQFSAASAAAIQAIALSPAWQSAPVDEGLGKLGPIQILKFQRRME